MSVSNVSILERLSWCLNVLFHQAVAVVFIYIIGTAFASFAIDSYFTWHIVLTTTGYVLLMLEALILFMKPNIFTLHIKRTTKYTIHGALMALSAILITIGVALMISQKDKNNSDHFTSLHGRLGLSSFILLWVTVFGGIMARYTNIFGKMLPGKYIKLCHIILGSVSLILGLITLGYGIDKNIFRLFSTSDSVTAAMVTMGLLAGWALIDTCISIVNKFRG